MDRFADADGAIRRAPTIGDAYSPAELFFNSIITGAVQRRMVYCDHVGPNPMLLYLTRGSKAWLLGCDEHVKRELVRWGQDTRCDWCGRWRPDAAVPMAVQMASLIVVAQFCRRCELRITS